MDQIVPWKSFKQAAADMDTSDGVYSNESAVLLGDIRTQLLNVIDTYHSATQNIYEWCDVSKPLLEAYTRLFIADGTTMQTMQNNFLVQLLEEQKQRIENGQIQLGDCVEYLQKTSQHLTALNFHLNKDLDENGEFFQRKLKVILLTSQATSTKSCQWTMCCGNGSTDTDSAEEKHIRELKEKLNAVRVFYVNLKVQVDLACVDLKHVKEKLNDKMHEIDKQKARLGEIKAYAVVGDIAELQDSVIESVNRLIANCDEYQNSDAH